MLLFAKFESYLEYWTHSFPCFSCYHYIYVLFKIIKIYFNIIYWIPHMLVENQRTNHSNGCIQNSKKDASQVNHTNNNNTLSQNWKNKIVLLSCGTGHAASVIRANQKYLCLIYPENGISINWYVSNSLHGFCYHF